MGSYTLSGEADRDIEEIARNSIERWGVVRAEAYVLGLHETLAHLAAFPDLGRGIDHVREGYRRMESASHSIFYRKTDTDILIVRVLHERMDPERHL